MKLFNKKKKPFFLVAGILLILLTILTLFPAAPKSIFGGEARAIPKDFYAGNKLPNTWIMPIGRGYDGNNNDFYSKSYLDSDNLSLFVRWKKTSYLSSFSGDYGYQFTTVAGSCGSMLGKVSSWEYAVYVDDNYAGTFGEIFGELRGSQGNNQRLYYDPVTGVGAGETTFCSGLQCDRLKAYGYGVQPDWFASAVFVKKINTMSIDNNKTVHSVTVKLLPKVLQGQVGECFSNTTYLDPNNTAAVRADADIFLNSLGITPREEYYSKISYYGRTNCVSGNCCYGPGCSGMMRIYSFNISSFPELKTPYEQIAYTTQIYIEPKACAEQTNYVTKMFTATAGDVVSLNPQIGQIGVPSNAIFCHTLPVLKQTLGTTFEQDYEPYETLKKGQNITIPAGHNWIFFYKDVPTNTGIYFCADKNGIFNSTTNRCEITPTIEYICVSGVFDPIKKVCITQATAEKICTEGVYNTATGQCEYNPPNSIICLDGVYNEMTKKCEINPLVNNICTKGVFDSTTQLCVYNPNTVNICIKGVYDSSNNLCVYTPVTQVACAAGILEGDKCILQPEVVNGLSSAGWMALSIIGVVIGATLFAIYILFIRKKGR